MFFPPLIKHLSLKFSPEVSLRALNAIPVKLFAHVLFRDSVSSFNQFPFEVKFNRLKEGIFSSHFPSFGNRKEISKVSSHS